MLRDREELQALWWLFGGSSFLTGKRFSDLSPGTAALMAGAELTTLVNPPAAIGLIAIARRAVKEKGEESMPFATLMSDVSADTMALAAPDSSFGLSIKGNPLLFPVSRFVLFSVDAGRPADMAYAAGLREVPVTVAQIAEQFASEKALLSLITEA